MMFACNNLALEMSFASCHYWRAIDSSGMYCTQSDCYYGCRRLWTKTGNPEYLYKMLTYVKYQPNKPNRVIGLDGGPCGPYWFIDDNWLEDDIMSILPENDPELKMFLDLWQNLR